MNVSCQSIDVTCTSTNANSRFANAGTIAKPAPEEFQGLRWEGPQEVR